MERIWKPNVVVAAVAERDGKFLLVEEEAGGRLVINQPAGHWDPGETLLQACVRETLEETAYAFKPTALLGVLPLATGEGDKTYLRFAFTGEIGALDSTRKLDVGIVRALWLSAEEVRACRDKHRSPLVMACIERYLRGARYSLDVIADF